MEPLTSADSAVRIVFHGDREDGKRACVYVSVWKYVSVYESMGVCVCRCEYVSVCKYVSVCGYMGVCVGECREGVSVRAFSKASRCCVCPDELS